MKIWKRIVATYAVVSMALLGIPAPAVAGLVATDQVAAAARGAQAERSRVEAALARQDVQDGLIRHGVKPQDVKSRVDALTDEEARLVANQIDQLPAGGDSVLGVLLLIFLVLLFTDIMGWTKVFPFTKSMR
ncbi:MAG TPA: PA2779 family protein [Burkholderiales bacterium]|nr:PA2779 family protein [Burkholderiales bacterium]